MTDKLEALELKPTFRAFDTTKSAIKLNKYIAVLISGDALKMFPPMTLDRMFYPFSVLMVEMPCCGRKGGLTRDVFERDRTAWVKKDIRCPCGKENHWIVKYDWPEE